MSNVAGRRDGMVNASDGAEFQVELCTEEKEMEKKKKKKKSKQTEAVDWSSRRSTMYIIKIHGRWRIHIPRI